MVTFILSEIEMSGNNTLEISRWEKKWHDGRMTHLTVDGAVSSRGQSQILLPLFLTFLVHFSDTTEEIQCIPCDKHTHGWGWGGGGFRECLNGEVQWYMHLLISGDLCTHDLIKNWACRSKHPGSTIPIGIIRTEVKDSSAHRTTTVKKNRKTHFFSLLSSTDHVQSQWIVPTVPRIMVQREWLKTNRRSGENKNPKIYIYAHIYIYLYLSIYILTRYLSTKWKNPRFQNRQSVFFQMCPCLWGLKKPLILIEILKNKTGNLCCPSFTLVL